MGGAGGAPSSPPVTPNAPATTTDSTNQQVPSFRDSWFWPIWQHNMSLVSSLAMPDISMHVMEPSHNTVDWYHFQTVHHQMCVHFLAKWAPILAEYIAHPPRSKVHKSKDDDGSEFEDWRILVWDQNVGGDSLYEPQKQIFLVVRRPFRVLCGVWSCCSVCPLPVRLPAWRVAPLLFRRGTGA